MTTRQASRLFALMVTFLQATHRAAERALQDQQVSPAQFFILRSLAARTDLTQGALAEALGVTAGNISQLVTKLESARLVRRIGEGRAKYVTLTADGERVVTRLAPHHEAFLRGRFAALNETERRSLEALMEKLIAAAVPGARGPSRSTGPRAGSSRRRLLS